MACNFPVGIYRRDGSPTYRPCGSCIGCRLEYARQWAVRCVHEASLHDQNTFLTLTYNPENLPKDKSVDKTELTKFIKRLRKKIEPHKIRFYGCGEYGEKLSRPHYHLCLFNYDFPDKKIRKHAPKRIYKNRVKIGPNFDLYTSQQLSNLWGKGFCTIGELTFESAGYVARYVTKKITGEKAGLYYKKRQPEFALMSRMPGIGMGWLSKYMSDIYPKDFHTMRGIRQRPTRYYDAIYKKLHPQEFEELKLKRIKNSEKIPFESSLRGYQKEKYTKAITKTLERKIEK